MSYCAYRNKGRWIQRDKETNIKKKGDEMNKYV